MSTHSFELNEGQREMLYSALEVLDPDTEEACDILEVLTQKVLDTLEDPEAFELTFTADEVVLAADALDILSPDDPDVDDAREDLHDRFHEVKMSLAGFSPEM